MNYTNSRDVCRVYVNLYAAHHGTACPCVSIRVSHKVLPINSRWTHGLGMLGSITQPHFSSASAVDSCLISSSEMHSRVVTIIVK